MTRCLIFAAPVSPFPRRRESRPKLATKEIPAFAGMESVLLAFRPNLPPRPKLIFWIPAYAGMTAGWGEFGGGGGISGGGENFAAKLAAAAGNLRQSWRRRNLPPPHLHFLPVSILAKAGIRRLFIPAKAGIRQRRRF
ncbi:MAG: hypothetical protein HAW59_01335 [Betaproteobacteria bacterium]|nr:hypothetical protein [Betaproteobacteria bacterium]